MNVLVYLLGLLSVMNLMAIWFDTNLSAHLSSLVTSEKHLTRDDVANWLISHEWYIAAELYICPLCSGTWLSFLTAVAMVAFGAPAWMIPAGMFSWPYIAYRVLKLIQPKNEQ